MGRQEAIAFGINNKIEQNIIKINQYDSTLYTSLDGKLFKSPRSRMQLESAFEPLDKIDISTIKNKLTMSTRWIKCAQNKDDYGLPTDDVGSESCTWASSGLLWSSWVIDGQTPPWWEKCLRWILFQTNPDNGIPIVKRMDSSITDATAFTLMCTSVAGEEFQKTADNLCAWILDMQDKGGWKWSILARDYNFISSGLALLSLKIYYHITGRRPEQIGNALEEGIRFLVNHRNIDGGWGSFPLDSSRPANTGYITYVLSVLNQESQAIESLPYLKSTFEKTIGWNNSMDRPASHNVTRLGLPYSLLGLSSLAKSTERNQLLKDGFEILLARYQNGVYVFPETSARSWPTRDCIFCCASIVG